MSKRPERIYPITDRGLSGLSHVEQVRRLIAGGARFIQLRDKHASPAEFYAEAREALHLAREHGVKIIINDRVDIALALGADGVHLGQDDLPSAEARRLMGEQAIIGYSTHNLKQARLAIEQPIDYLALGPIFTTTTKADADPVAELDTLRAVREIAEGLPIVAIGGINLHNIKRVFDAGADSVAIISDILAEPELISERFRNLSGV